jgi:hypothetical protein
MKTGLREAISINADIILLLDADIKNLTPEWIDSLVDGCTNCDVVRGFYLRHARDAAVTKLIAKPMLHIYFPELSHFEQVYISGFRSVVIFGRNESILRIVHDSHTNRYPYCHTFGRYNSIHVGHTKLTAYPKGPSTPTPTPTTVFSHCHSFNTR